MAGTPRCRTVLPRRWVVRHATSASTSAPQPQPVRGPRRPPHSGESDRSVCQALVFAAHTNPKRTVLSHSELRGTQDSVRVVNSIRRRHAPGG